jgi:hypothetical protein
MQQQQQLKGPLVLLLPLLPLLALWPSTLLLLTAPLLLLMWGKGWPVGLECL